MTPLTNKPTIVIRIDDFGEVVSAATNIAPFGKEDDDLNVQITKSHRLFDELAAGKAFRLPPTF